MMLLQTPSSAGDNCVIFLQGRVDFASDIAFEAADELALAHSLPGAPAHVRLGAAIIAKPYQDDAIESRICLAGDQLELHEGAFGSGDRKLDKVELRWVAPHTGQSRGQQAEVIGRIGADRTLIPLWFDADPLLQVGAIVALAADRYSVLPDGYEDVDPSADLSRLSELLGSLRSNLGGLDAYRDFSFLLGRMVETAVAQAPPATPSGYSP